MFSDAVTRSLLPTPSSSSPVLNIGTTRGASLDTPNARRVLEKLKLLRLHQSVIRYSLQNFMKYRRKKGESWRKVGTTALESCQMRVRGALPSFCKCNAIFIAPSFYFPPFSAVLGTGWNSYRLEI